MDAKMQNEQTKNQGNNEHLSSYPNILRFAYSGVMLSLAETNGKTLIIPDPQDVLTAEMKEELKVNRESIIHEVRNWESNDLTFLWTTSMDFSSWEDSDCRYGWEIGREPTYRVLTAEFYAYLRSRMTVAKRNFDAKKIDSSVFEALRSRFNIIHAYAVRRFAESDLAESIKKLDPKTYIPPSSTTLSAYTGLMQASRTGRLDSSRLYGELSEQIGKFQRQLVSRGFAVLKSRLEGVDLPIIISHPELIPANQLPRPYQANTAQFTVREALSLRNLKDTDSSNMAIVDIINVRSVFPGSALNVILEANK